MAAILLKKVDNAFIDQNGIIYESVDHAGYLYKRNQRHEAAKRIVYGRLLEECGQKSIDEWSERIYEEFKLIDKEIVEVVITDKFCSV